MEEVVKYFIVWCFGALCASVGFLILRYYELKRLNTLLKDMEEFYRQKFEEMIYRINHNGAIPDSASLRGLIKLIILVIKSCITSLWNLWGKQEWNTKLVIEELQTIIHTEFKFLEKEFEEFSESVHTILKDYDKYQHNKDKNRME